MASKSRVKSPSSVLSQTQEKAAIWHCQSVEDKRKKELDEEYKEEINKLADYFKIPYKRMLAFLLSKKLEISPDDEPISKAQATTRAYVVKCYAEHKKCSEQKYFLKQVFINMQAKKEEGEKENG